MNCLFFSISHLNLHWKEKGLKIVQKTNYPEEQGSTIEFTCEKPVKLALKVRYPFWARNGIEILINGKRKQVNQDPEALSILKEPGRQATSLK